MDVKKYIVTNMQEAVAKIKEDMGSEAIIISTRKVRQGKGVFGMFGKESLEVTATAPTNKENLFDGFDTSKTAAMANRQSHQAVHGSYPGAAPPYLTQSVNDNDEPALSEMLLEPLRIEIEETKSLIEELREGLTAEKNAVDNIQHLRHEIHELKGLINLHLNNEQAIPFKNLHKNLASVYQQLIVNGVEEKFTKRLIEEARFKIPLQNFDNAHYVRLYMARMIMQLVKVTDIFADKPTNKKNIFSFIGPTGAGKTTVLAKIAGLIKQREPNAEIGIVTLDTIRTGSIETLKSFSKTIRAGFRACTDESQLTKAIQDFKDKQYILIDTPGSSQRESNAIREIGRQLGVLKDVEHLLVLSSSTKDSDLTEQTKRFGILKLTGTIFCKLDESTNYGNMLNHLIRFKVPLFFIAAGQKVPDDIEVAAKERVIDLIMNFSEVETLSPAV